MRVDPVLQFILQYQDDGIPKKYRVSSQVRSGQVLFSPLSITQFMLGHMGLKLTPLALYKSVRENHQELAAPVYAINYILRHCHSDLDNNTEELQITPSLKR